MAKLNALQLQVLAAAARDEVYRDDRPPYTAYMEGHGRAITQTAYGLFHRYFLQLGRKDRFTLYFAPTDAGLDELAARGLTEANGWRRT